MTDSSQLVVFVREPKIETTKAIPEWTVTTSRVLSLVRARHSLTSRELVESSGYELETLSAELNTLKRIGAVRMLQEITGRGPVNLQWSLSLTKARTTLYFHAGPVRIRMARVSSELADDIQWLVNALGMSSSVIDEEAGNVVYVFMKVLPYTRNRTALKELTRRLDAPDIQYWAWKFGCENQVRVASAFKKLNSMS